ncbi:MAG: hypothetical protein WCA16_07455, partial [Candidatus Sulfotelmatobacter sp.]
ALPHCAISLDAVEKTLVFHTLLTGDSFLSRKKGRFWTVKAEYLPHATQPAPPNGATPPPWGVATLKKLAQYRFRESGNCSKLLSFGFEPTLVYSGENQDHLLDL